MKKTKANDFLDRVQRPRKSSVPASLPQEVEDIISAAVDRIRAGEHISLQVLADELCVAFDIPIKARTLRGRIENRVKGIA